MDATRIKSKKRHASRKHCSPECTPASPSARSHPHTHYCFSVPFSFPLPFSPSTSLSHVCARPHTTWKWKAEQSGERAFARALNRLARRAAQWKRSRAGQPDAERCIRMRTLIGSALPLRERPPGASQLDDVSHAQAAAVAHRSIDSPLLFSSRLVSASRGWVRALHRSLHHKYEYGRAHAYQQITIIPGARAAPRKYSAVVPAAQSGAERPTH